jgi:sulfite reductase (NADPH) hemoprotein beta-component
VFERVAQFRDQVERFMAGELSEEEFLPLRLQNGLYLQKHAYMLRVAIPYGTLSAAQMRTLASIAADYDRGYGHFTTRQNMQFNWIELAEVPDILNGWRRSTCMRSRPPATACATSPPKPSPGLRQMS